MRISKNVLRLLGASVATLVVCVSLFSQANSGRILGTITDMSGGAIAGATVTVTDVERGTNRILTTDESGSYSAPNLIPGNYTIKVEYKGFRTVDRQNIVLEVGKEVRVDLSLQPGEQTQTITVTEALPLVETTNATLGGTLQPGTIQDLPLNGRNFMNLLQLRPGVTVCIGGGAWTQSTNGLRPEHNVYILDGITAMEPLGSQSTINSVSLAGDAATLLPIDTIQEFNTQQNPKAHDFSSVQRQDRKQIKNGQVHIKQSGKLEQLHEVQPYVSTTSRNDSENAGKMIRLAEKQWNEGANLDCHMVNLFQRKIND